jgi:quercetin dioxygenase-like cupin family protein
VEARVLEAATGEVTPRGERIREERRRDLMRDAIVRVLAIVLLAGCAASPKAVRDDHSAMAAASGVARADRGKGPREHRIIPLKRMEGDVEILYGDPESDDGQPFVMRIRELPGTIIPPHSHPVDEHLTVVEGTFYFALGQEFDKAALKEIKAGGYAFAPKGSWMFGSSPDGAVVQVHGVGPFRIHWHGGLHSLNDADAKSVFRFGRGMRVADSRRAGKIVEGYASGKIIQYEIETDGGERFMASEEDLREQR